ncbi:alcohol dehydrogenase catalytic domain-containing protein [Granulicoccus sp. GXG6511]|uniref:alcohol dehydrogenase catalytic domain-containing protein n=1 Tax=Granulicoccus sp. GXG6511 TaxID=3381351 RepID=UPI003D7E0B03
MEIPSTMRASVLRGVRNLAVEERDVPVPGPEEVLIRVAAAAVSGADVQLYATGRLRGTPLRGPLVLGRTAAGHIAAVGEGVPADRIGELVALEPLRICRHCPQCRQGRYNLCQTATFLGTPGCDGVFAEYVTHPADFAHPVPNGVPVPAAVVSEPTAIALAALHKADIGAGSKVLVAGAGPIGLITVAVAKALGAVEVAISDLSGERLQRAQAMGATDTFNMARAGIVIPSAHFDAFIECSGSAAAIRRGFPGVRPAGHVVLVGRGADEVALPITLMQNRELAVHGSFRYANTFPIAIAMIAADRVPTEGLIGDRFTLEQLDSALDPTRAATGMKAYLEIGDMSA